MTKGCARGLLMTSAAMILAPTAVQAQTAAEATAQAADQPAAPAATTATDDEGSDQDIVVTARRTEENVQRVPSAVSAFNERSLDRIQATDEWADISRADFLPSASNRILRDNS